MTSYDISIGTDFAAQGAVLRELKLLADSRGVEILVIGALSRDLMIRGVTGIPPERMTADIDVAIAVDSWPSLTTLTQGLTRGKNLHSFRIQGTQVDIIPFDGVEDENRSITWPNHYTMDVLGVQEAFDAAIEVPLDGVVIKVASLPAQVILKLLAWRDRHATHNRDAIDLRTILLAYSDHPYSEGVWADEDALEASDFDLELAGANRLGYEAISLMKAEGALVVRDLVNSQCADPSLLASQMSNNIAHNRLLLESLSLGMARAFHQTNEGLNSAAASVSQSAK